MAGDFSFDDAIASAQRLIDSETSEHVRRMEFWKGYQCAMREVQQHLPPKSVDGVSQSVGGVSLLSAEEQAQITANIALADWMEADPYRTLTGCTESMVVSVVLNAYRAALAP